MALGNQYFAIDMMWIQEIVQLQPITQVHDTPACIEGLMNLRGHIVPVINGGERLKLGRTKHTERTCVVIFDFEEQTVGFTVDRVVRVVDLPEDESYTPTSEKAFRVDGEVLVRIDPQSLLETESLLANWRGEDP